MVDSNPGLTARLEEEAFRTAMFHNFSKEAFTGYWNGKPRTFQPGDRKYMPKYLAEHYAKHLTNRELIKMGKETATSPKKPEQVPEFMALFNKAYVLEDDGTEQHLDAAQHQEQLAEREHEHAQEPKVGDDEKAQIIGGEDADDDDEFDT